MSKHKERLAQTLAEFDTLPNSANVKTAVICRHLDISSTTLWRWAREGRIPTPIDGRVNVGEYRAALKAIRKQQVQQLIDEERHKAIRDSQWATDNPSHDQYLYVEKENLFVVKCNITAVYHRAHSINRIFRKVQRPILEGKEVSHATFIKANYRLSKEEFDRAEAAYHARRNI